MIYFKVTLALQPAEQAPLNTSYMLDGRSRFHSMAPASVFYRVRSTPFPVFNSTGNRRSRLVRE